MGNYLRIKWCNGLGNSLFQYCFARIIAEKNNLILTYSKETRPSNIVSPIGYGLLQEGKHIEYIKEDVEELNFWNKETKVVYGNCDSLIQKDFSNKNWIMPYYYILEDYNLFYPYLDKIKSWFDPIEKTNNNDLIVHFRLSDHITKPNRVIPITKYMDIIDKIKYDKLYISTCDPSNSDLFRDLKKYNYIMLSTEVRKDVNSPNLKTTLRDFNTIRSFDKIVMGNSTFAWWGAVLSEATEIYIYENWKGSKDPVNLGKTNYLNWKKF